MKRDLEHIFGWIAHHLRLRGMLSRVELMDAYGKQRTQAFEHLALYRRWAQEHDQPDLTLKARHSVHYVAVPQDHPTVKDGEIASIADREDLNTAQALALLDTLRGHCLMAEHNPQLPGNGCFFPVGSKGVTGPLVIEISSSTHPRLDGPDVATLLLALHRQACLSFSYSTKANVRSRRTVSPHRLIFSGGVYHLRAHCHLKEKMIDFNLARIHEARDTDEPFVGLQYDKEWITPVDLHFYVNPALTAAQHEVLQRTYPLNGEATHMRVTTTKALAYYIDKEVLSRTMNDPEDSTRRLPCFFSAVPPIR